MAKDQSTGDIKSLLDTDMYKLTMQCVIHAFYGHVHVSYRLTNRTPHMKLNQAAFEWLQHRVAALGNIRLSDTELAFLRRECHFLDHAGYLEFLKSFHFRPSEHVKLDFHPAEETDLGTLDITIKGLWVETILYEIPLLALVSEAYFRFVDTEWTHDGQVELAREKGVELLNNGCTFSEFGTRRRRDFQTQDLVMQGLQQANSITKNKIGTYTGTSNVYFALKYGVTPVGTVAHEWFMGLAAYTNDYANATNLALQAWVDCFGMGTLSIALTDTFGTTTFLRAFSNRVPLDGLKGAETWTEVSEPRYADIFAGVRQDSGDPKKFVTTMRNYYDGLGIKEPKTIVFSDSLNVKRCLEYKQVAEAEGFKTSFGVGTFFTNDFYHPNGDKSVPMNIVIKLASANGQAAIKLSDDMGKHTGDEATVERVKEQLHYVDRHWEYGDESHRWDNDHR